MKLLHPSDAAYEVFCQEIGKNNVENLITFLRQFKRANPYEDVEISDIRGFSTREIFEFLNQLTVFYGLSPIMEAGEGKFKVNSTLSREISGFEEALKKIEGVKPYVVFTNDVFIYHQNKLDIEPTSYAYTILKFLYENFEGKSGFILYDKLCKSLKKTKRFKTHTIEEIRELVLQYGTSNTEGIGAALKYGKTHNKSESNGFRLVGTVRGRGVYFNNGQKPV